MTSRLSKKQLNDFGAIGLFIATIVIIILLFPTENKFIYQFEVGKPWTYELMTASYDFPIYKSKNQINEEREKVLTDYSPFFRTDTSVVSLQIVKLLSDRQKSDGISPMNAAFITKKMNQIYAKGVMSMKDYNNLISEKRQTISNPPEQDHKKVHTSRDLHASFSVRRAIERCTRNIKNIQSEWLYQRKSGI